MRRHPRRAQVDPTAPRAWATDDRTGFIGNHKDLKWQYDWRGNQLTNLRILTFDPDEPQRQLGTLLIPPDPPPLYNARPEAYFIDEYANILLESADRVYADVPIMAEQSTDTDRIPITLELT